jgi:hypothetical protein
MLRTSQDGMIMLDAYATYRHATWPPEQPVYFSRVRRTSKMTSAFPRLWDRTKGDEGRSLRGVSYSLREGRRLHFKRQAQGHRLCRAALLRESRRDIREKRAESFRHGRMRGPWSTAVACHFMGASRMGRRATLSPFLEHNEVRF